MSDRPRPLPFEAQFYSLNNLQTPIQDDQAFNEIANAIMRLRAAFLKAGFGAPVSIELASHDDGFRMRHILPRDMIAAYPSEALRNENDTDVLFNVMGVEFRYPAKFRLERGRMKTL